MLSGYDQNPTQGVNLSIEVIPSYRHYEVPEPLLDSYKLTVADLMEDEGEKELKSAAYEYSRMKSRIDRGLEDNIVVDPMRVAATLENSVIPGENMETIIFMAVEHGILETFSIDDASKRGKELTEFFHNGALKYTASHIRNGVEYDAAPCTPEEHKYRSDIAEVWNMRDRTILADTGGWEDKAKFFIDEADLLFKIAHVNPNATPQRVVSNLIMALACKKFALSPPPVLEETVEAVVIDSLSEPSKVRQSVLSRLLGILSIR